MITNRSSVAEEISQPEIRNSNFEIGVGFRCQVRSGKRRSEKRLAPSLSAGKITLLLHYISLLIGPKSNGQACRFF